ncbi:MULTISPECIES: helix-turn-helix domain-containing protein [Nocardiopsidaceae]|uniref:Helix-turn-helix transcriptional regulator n=1 Tax=Streptomonospora nanhaiensis TaxID=1323731 RepID=A0ABY6YM82_9ACTN|nr:helix-turn-helix transcriptional regulator [Streptomonospora nanhaiensis]WAE73326.1 helix-turn-helix transcriptional regulator [Streptomonospora nanhaiensis]
MTTPGPRVLRLQLGREIRRLREGANLTRDDLARALSCGASKVSKIESGFSTVTSTETSKLVKLFKLSADEAATFRDLAASARKRGSYGKVLDFARGYVSMEADAGELKFFYEELVPAPFQTRAYATAVCSTSVTIAPADIDQVVQGRLERASILTDASPPKVAIILGEGVLHRTIGGVSVLREQLEHLHGLAQRPHIDLQILPYSSGEHAAMGTGFTLLNLREVEATYVYLEDLTSSDFWDRPQHTGVYELVFNKLQVAALGKRESILLIEDSIRALNERNR